VDFQAHGARHIHADLKPQVSWMPKAVTDTSRSGSGGGPQLSSAASEAWGADWGPAKLCRCGEIKPTALVQESGAVDFMATFIWKTLEKAGKRWKGNFDQRLCVEASNIFNYQAYMGSGGKVWESNPPGTSIAPYRI